MLFFQDVRVTNSVHADFTCETQLQVLTDHVRELELELDELRLIKDAEGEKEISYKELVTPKLQDKGIWVIVRSEKGNMPTVQGLPVAVPLDKMYTALDIVEGAGGIYQGKPIAAGFLALCLALWLRREGERIRE